MQISTHIDKSGRIVIPKEMRDDSGLLPGELVILEKTPQGILLKPQPAELMVEHNGIWVYHPVAARPYDPVEIIRQVREERS